jgi:hypothetical protein
MLTRAEFRALLRQFRAGMIKPPAAAKPVQWVFDFMLE